MKPAEKMEPDIYQSWSNYGLFLDLPLIYGISNPQKIQEIPIFIRLSLEKPIGKSYAETKS